MHEYCYFFFLPTQFSSGVKLILKVSKPANMINTKISIAVSVDNDKIKAPHDDKAKVTRMDPKKHKAAIDKLKRFLQV